MFKIFKVGSINFFAAPVIRQKITRSRTGSLAPKAMSDYVTATKGSLTKAMAKKEKDENWEPPSASKEHVRTARMTRSKIVAESQGVNQSTLFRLGKQSCIKTCKKSVFVERPHGSLVLNDLVVKKFQEE